MFLQVVKDKIERDTWIVLDTDSIKVLLKTSLNAYHLFSTISYFCDDKQSPSSGDHVHINGRT